MLIEQLSHLSVLICQILQEMNLSGVLLLECVHFGLHVLDLEVLKLEDLLDLLWQVGILVNKVRGGGAARTVSIARAAVVLPRAPLNLKRRRVDVVTHVDVAIVAILRIDALVQMVIASRVDQVIFHFYNYAAGS